MLRFLFCFLFPLILVPMLAAQDFESAIYRLYGDASVVSSLDETDLWRLQHYYSSPLRLNDCNKSALVRCGLFSPYQVASILDYRERMGEILSVAELALVDGFGEYLAEALAPFLSFEKSTGKPAAGTSVNATGQFRAKKDAAAWLGRVKAETSWADAALAARTVYSDKDLWPPSARAFYVGADYGRVRVVAGDFAFRFGQGLAAWSGMSFSGATTPLALYKRGSGIVGSTSLAGSSVRGAAAIISWKRLILSPFWAKGPGGNLSWLLPVGQFGISYYDSVASADCRFCFSGVDIFAEAAVEMKKALAGLCGAVFPIGERGRLGFQGRYYPAGFSGKHSGALRTWSKTSDESGITLSYGCGDLAASADFACRLSQKRKQLKIIVSDIFKISPVWALKLKAQYRTRDYGNGRTRSELRSDLCYTRPSYAVNLRLDAVHCDKTGFLSYAESGIGPEKGNRLWLRATLFWVDKWNDRVYSYERDAPGSFLVPSYYGRGFAASAYYKAKFSLGRRGSLSCYARVSFTGYWKNKKPSVPELRLSVAYSY